MTSLQAFWCIAVVAICTFLTRVAPFLLFGGKRQPPAPVKYLGQVLPPAILATLVIYCLKNMQLLSYPYGLPELIAAAAVIFLHLWKRNNLLSIGVGTLLYMLLIQFIF